MRYAVIKNGIVVNVCKSDTPLQDNWIESPYASVGDLYDAESGIFSKPIIAFDYAKAWEDIKAERDKRIQQGGYIASGKWFHSDTFSRSQQLGLVMIGPNIPSGLMWKTMDGSFIEMTQSLANEVFLSATTSDAALFSYAETLKAQVDSSNDPSSIDIYSGWPVSFLDQ